MVHRDGGNVLQSGFEIDGIKKCFEAINVLSETPGYTEHVCIKLRLFKFFTSDS